MCKAFWHDNTLSLTLEHIVTDRMCGSQPFFNIARLHPILILRRPNARVAVGLKLHRHLQAVTLHLARARLGVLHFVCCSGQVLNVMPYLMRNDIRLGKVTGRAKAVLQFVIEGRIDVNLLIRRTIKRPHRGLGGTTTRLTLTVIKLNARLAVTTVAELLVPCVVVTFEYETRKFGRFVAVAGGAVTACRRGLYLLRWCTATAKHVSRVHAKHQSRNNHDQDGTASHAAPANTQPPAAAAGKPKAAAATLVIRIDVIVEIAIVQIVEPHRAILLYPLRANHTRQRIGCNPSQRHAHAGIAKLNYEGFPMRLMRLAVTAALFGSTSAIAATSQLPRGVSPTHYDITVRPDAEKMVFTGSETITISVEAPTKSITLNALELAISKATLDGKLAGNIALDATAQTMTVTFDTPIAAGTHTLYLAFSGKINTSAAGMFALDYKTVDGADARMIGTQFEAPDARRFAPMWDEPSYKATFRVSAIAPKGQSAFSNMPVEKMSKADGGTLFRFGPTPKMSSYLLFLGMGDVERKTKMAGNVEVGIITRKGVAGQGDYALDAAVEMIRYYNDYFGTPYPLPKLDMIAAPGSSQFFGAMENWGAILYFERTVLIDPKLVTESQRQNVYATVGHEIAHQWFGNLVTMAWWDDLWLNEGFASWMESKLSHDMNPNWGIPAQAVSGGRQGAMSLDARSTTHAIVQKIQTVDQISQAFDTITYQKGEAVIGMLESTLGKDAFRAGIRTYMKKYAYQNTETSQLWDELAASSGQPVADMMRSFTTQGGVPLIRVGTPRCINGKTEITLSQDRFGLDAPSKKPLSWKVPVTLGLAGGAPDAATKTTVEGAALQAASITGCGVPVVNQGQKGYFRTLYSPTHFAVLKDKFARLAVEDQVGLLSDSLALANGDYATIEQHLSLIASLPEDASPFVWAIASRQLSGIDFRLNNNPNQASFHRKAAAILAPVLKQVGWIARDGEATAVAQLREELLPALAQFGAPEVVAEAKRYTDLSFTDANAVPGPVRLTALAAYSRNIDAAGWEALHEKAKAEQSPVAKQLYYQALGSSADAKLAQRALDLALTDEAPVPIRSSIIAAVADEHPALAFDWAAARNDKINAILEDSSKSEFIVGLATNGSDLGLAKRVKAYALANLPAASRARAEQAIAFITYRTSRKTVEVPSIIRWAKAK
jgi:aminopeptidase N